MTVGVNEVREDRERLNLPLDDRDRAAEREIDEPAVFVTELRGVAEVVIVNDDIAVVEELEDWVCDSRGEFDEESVPPPDTE